MSTPTMRRADLPSLVQNLRALDVRKLDVVARADSLRMDDDGNLHVPGVGEPVITDDGVTTPEAVLGFTDTAESTGSDRLGIPVGYWRRCAASSTPLLAHNVNHWLQEAGAKRLLVRALTGVDGEQGIVRALLSDGYKMIDNLDVTLAVLQGIRDAGVDPKSVEFSGDLTSKHLQLRITAPGVSVDASDLVGRYRGTGPARGRDGTDYPLVFAGLALRNSETGQGAWSITPRATWQVCTNGMTRSKDSVRSVHLGAKMAEGVIDWSADTREKEVGLIAAQARDAVRQYLSPTYLQTWLDELRVEAGRPVTRPEVAVERVQKTLGFPDAVRDELLAEFIAGGDTSVLGLAQAVTAWARDTDDAEAAATAEAGAWDAALAATR